jgi:hypothetical protein
MGMELQLPAMVRADVLHHARSRASGANVHKVESTIQVYVFACEEFEHVRDASRLMPASAAIRRRLTQARAGVKQVEAELWSM